jgi:hypothetical protein
MKASDPLVVEAREWYIANEGEGRFENALLRSLAFGVVFKRKGMLCMGEKVVVRGNEIDWNSDEAPNCWYIHCITSNPRKTVAEMTSYMDLAGEELPLIARQKKGKLRIYSWNRAKKE